MHYIKYIITDPKISKQEESMPDHEFRCFERRDLKERRK